VTIYSRDYNRYYTGYVLDFIMEILSSICHFKLQQSVAWDGLFKRLWYTVYVLYKHSDTDASIVYKCLLMCAWKYLIYLCISYAIKLQSEEEQKAYVKAFCLFPTHARIVCLYLLYSLVGFRKLTLTEFMICLLFDIHQLLFYIYKLTNTQFRLFGWGAKNVVNFDRRDRHMRWVCSMFCH